MHLKTAGHDVGGGENSRALARKRRQGARDGERYLAESSRMGIEYAALTRSVIDIDRAAKLP